jgi:hypothetical protein
MTRLRHIRAVVVALCMLGACAPAAYAKDGDYHHVIRECYDTGTLDGSKYTLAALKKARRKLPTDVREYSDCEDLINAAIAGYNRGSRGGGGGAGGAPPNPAFTTPSQAVASSKEDFDALNRETDPKTRSQVPPAVPLGDTRVSPTTGGIINAAKGTNSNDLPLPLILSLAGLAILSALAAATVLRQRWPQARSAALRLFRR